MSLFYPLGQTMDETKLVLFIIDDDASVRKSLQRLLQAHQFQVETFACAEDYLCRENYTGIGAIILDLSMPGLNGIDLQVRLLESGSQLPIIFLTGHGDIHASVTAMKQGAENFLTKPVDEKQLLASVHDALAKHSEIHKKQIEIQTIQQNISSLTSREFEVMRYVISGALNKLIACQLSIAEKTVKVHRGRVQEKMQAKSVVVLVRLCDAVDIQPLSITPTQQHIAIEN